MPMNDDCLFCKIIAGKILLKKVYESGGVYVFEDINPKAPGSPNCIRYAARRRRAGGRGF